MTSHTDAASDGDWVRVHRDPETMIESVQAHFQGHAYDPHDHDEFLVGITQQGVQRFSCHRRVHTSVPGRSILIEPGAVHDGHAPGPEGFTYAMLYLPLPWMSDAMQRLELGDVSSLQSAFRTTLADDLLLGDEIRLAFAAIHHQQGRLARDQSLDRLLARLSRHLCTSTPCIKSNSVAEMERARSYLHANMANDIGLDELAAHSGIDRFRLTRQFKQAFGQTPHAYLVRLRLRVARSLLAGGKAPVEVAAEVGFADQSHLGLWFRRAYRLTPAAYQRQCTNLTD